MLAVLTLMKEAAHSSDTSVVVFSINSNLQLSLWGPKISFLYNYDEVDRIYPANPQLSRHLDSYNVYQKYVTIQKE
jgi:hypothetical protein